jgi:branched-chain amino acid transport system ATP-binding protein
MSTLEMRGLDVGYAETVVVRDATLRVASQKVTTILGSNGAGKSSLLKAAMGLASVRKGSVSLNGADITGWPSYKVVKHGMTLCPEGRRLFSSLSVYENLKLGAYLKRSRVDFVESLDYVFSLFPRVKERRGQTAGSLSGGEQQMVAIGRALMSRPQVLLLDEPTLGLAPKMIEEVANIVRSISRDGVSVLLVEQNARMALKVSDYAYVMGSGSIVHEGPSDTLIKDDEIARLYLGS